MSLKILFFVLTFSWICVAQEKENELKYEILTTWNNESIPLNETIKIQFMFLKNQTEKLNLLIEIEAPFYNDPSPNFPPGRVDGLWDFEVVEIFLLGQNETYLELEFGPRGHYLIYYLKGQRKLVNGTLILDNYKTQINHQGKRWTGRAVIPLHFLPPKVKKFNAYAIHGQQEKRIYSALFPVPFNSSQNPDFHNLNTFQPINFGL